MTKPEAQIFHDKAAILRSEYQKLLIDLQLWKVTDFAEFQKRFNEHFTKYQHVRKKKLIPDMLGEGYITCSSAAILFALWFVHIYPNTTPIFFVTVIDSYSKAAQHCSVAVHPDPNLTPTQALQKIPSVNAKTPDLSNGAFVHWTEPSKLVGLLGIPSVARQIVGLNKFAINRVATLGIRTKHLEYTGGINRS